MGMCGTFVAVEDEVLQRILNEGEEVEDLLEVLDLERCFEIDIDKSWDAMNYLFCRGNYNQNPPMGDVVPMREKNYLNLDVDCDAFSLTNQEVKEVNQYLQGLSEADIRQMFDFWGMVKEEVYIVSQEDEEEEIFAYVYFYLKELKAFYQKAAVEGKAVVFYIM